MERLPMGRLENRRLYRIRSRNLVVGVWDEAKHGFIGVREKFGSEYPFTEYHWDWDRHCGTVSHMEPMDEFLPSDIPLREGRFECQVCRGEARWVQFPVRADDGKYGKYVHADDLVQDEPEVKYYQNNDILEWLKPFSDAELKVRYAR